MSEKIKKGKKKKSNKKIFLNVAYIVLCIILISLIACDFLWTNYDLVDLEVGVSIILTANSIIFTVMISYLLFLKERYKQNNYNLSNEINVSLGLIPLFIVGIFLSIFYDKTFLSEIFYIIVSLLYIIICLILVFNKMKINEISRIISQLALETKNSLDSLSEDSKIKILRYLKRLNKIYKYEYLNNNIDACSNIILHYFSFLTKELNCRVGKSINKEENIDETLELFVKFYKHLIIKDKNDLSSILNNTIISKISEFAEILVKCEFTQTLELVLDNYNDIIKENLDFLNKDIAIRFLFEVCACSYDFQKFVIFEKINEKSLSILKYLSFITSDYNDAHLIYKYLISLLSQVTKKYDDYFKLIFKNFEFSILSNNIQKNNFYIFTGILKIINSEIYLEDKVKNDVYVIIMKMIEQRKILLDELFIDWITDYLDSAKLDDLNKEIEMKELICYNLIDMGVDVPEILLPKFDTIVLEKINDDNFNKYCIRVFDNLLYKCGLNKNRRTFISLLDNLSITIIKYSKSNKKEQKLWFEIFINLLNDSLFIKDSSFLESIIFYIKKTIYESDKDRKVSKDFGNYLINRFYDITLKYNINNDEICICFINLLNDLIDIERNLNFVYTNMEIEETIYEILYYIGIDSIEVGNENVLKEISNTLGWIIKAKIDKKQSTVVNTLIDYSAKLYELSYLNKLSDQVIVFVGTLFIIIGAYTMTQQTYKSYTLRIKSKINKDEYKENLLKSKMLRECKAKVWYDILGKNPKNHIESFWKFIFNSNK